MRKVSDYLNEGLRPYDSVDIVNKLEFMLSTAVG